MKIEIYKDKAGEFRWRALADNGNIVATSGEGYKNHGDLMDTLRSIRFAFQHAQIVGLTGKTD